MKRLIKCIFAPLICLCILGAQASAAGAPETTTVPHVTMKMGADAGMLTTPITFSHGDISWLPKLAAQAGWPKWSIKRLGEIILRESGGCPNRVGGDVVDKNCNFLRVAERTHRSDTGLLQINGVHWKKDHAQYAGLVCKKMGVCDQARLLDPLTNLKAGKLLFDVAGWSPWNTN